MFFCFVFLRKAEAVLSFDILHVRMFIQQNILWAMTLVKLIKNAGAGWQFFSKTLAEKELKKHCVNCGKISCVMISVFDINFTLCHYAYLVNGFGE